MNPTESRTAAERVTAMESFFGTGTKSELFKYENTSSCCDMAEFAGMLLLGCVISKNEIRLIPENPEVGSKFFGFVQKTRLLGGGCRGKKCGEARCNTNNRTDLFKTDI